MSPAAARWSRIVDRSHHTPLTLREFARREGVNPNTLAWWRWKLRDEECPRREGFVEVMVVDPPDPPQAPQPTRGLVVTVGDARIEVDGSSDLRLLRAVVEVLA